MCIDKTKLKRSTNMRKVCMKYKDATEVNSHRGLYVPTNYLSSKARMNLCSIDSFTTVVLFPRYPIVRLDVPWKTLQNGFCCAVSLFLSLWKSCFRDCRTILLVGFKSCFVGFFVFFLDSLFAFQTTKWTSPVTRDGNWVKASFP